ncbi:hypothetical protein CEE69_26665 [Rhodopirellula bahusiensis]|uniref:Uncharacterized protein n=1 Tax=Rhodopirellula bahusiensis TaxID=2014065 RepID=A0A2G1VZL4_9BACT|nr:hypothetical protein CEE69_26665 [Rhodopirellula bahusiensis]
MKQAPSEDIMLGWQHTGPDAFAWTGPTHVECMHRKRKLPTLIAPLSVGSEVSRPAWKVVAGRDRD